MGEKQVIDSEKTTVETDPDILSAQHSSQLCQACGICCSGTLFSYVDVNQKQANALKDTSVEPYKNEKGKLVFDLPCNALSGTRCTIYDKRPTVCRTYLCDLTRKVMNGSIDLEAASKTVADIKAKRAWLLENVPLDILRTYSPPPEENPVQTPAKKSTLAKAILAAWRTSTRAKPEVSQSLRVLLAELYGCFSRKLEKEGLSPSDKAYIVAAFSYAKLADRMFEKTPLLRTYAGLVQRF